MREVTLSVIKADVGSIGGHTKPSGPMLEAVRTRIREATGGLILDGLLTHTGDDLAILMSHGHGVGASEIHRFAWTVSSLRLKWPSIRVFTAPGKTCW